MSHQIAHCRAHYLAPVTWVDDPNSPDMKHYREPALTSVVRLTKYPLGMILSYPAFQPIEVVGDGTDPSWTDRFEVAVVPREQADRSRVYAWVLLEGAAKDGVPEAAHLVVPVEQARDEWERLEVARIPDEFWAQFGDFYLNNRVGWYVPADYRCTVSIVPEASPSGVPRAWVEYTWPGDILASINDLSPADLAAHRKKLGIPDAVDALVSPKGKRRGRGRGK